MAPTNRPHVSVVHAKSTANPATLNTACSVQEGNPGRAQLGTKPGQVAGTKEGQNLGQIQGTKEGTSLGTSVGTKRNSIQGTHDGEILG